MNNEWIKQHSTGKKLIENVYFNFVSQIYDIFFDSQYLTMVPVKFSNFKKLPPNDGTNE